tara:strand:- start:73 stop:330 length:258 start_codon:yes stop_codon:yes gene_type:complete
MADEFMKGFGILSIAGLAWMILSGWFNTPGFETTQLIAPVPSGLDFYGQFSIILREVVFWFAVVGALSFWVIIPAINEIKSRSNK